MSDFKSEIRDGMCVDEDVPIALDDDVVLREDVSRPTGPSKFPIVLFYGPYDKGLQF